MRDRQTDVIVVGGGLAGLAAAAYVGRTGRSVVLLEKAPAPGGRARTEYRSGYCFNLGAHALYTGGAASRVLAELGVSYTAGRPGQIGLLAGGRLQTMPATVKALLTSQALGLRDKIELATLLGSTIRTRPAALGQTSAQAWIEQHTHRPAVRQLMEATARTQLYTTALDLASADVLVSKLQLVSRYPIHYINGGWQTLVDGLRARAVAAGVRVLSGCAVEALTDGGVRLRDGQRLRGRSVILAVSQAEAQALLATAEPSLQLPEQTPVQLACLDVGLRQLPNPSAPIVQHLERPMFLTTQSRYAQVAPAGAALLHAFKQLDPRHAGDPKADAQELEQFLDTVQPGWREQVVERWCLPRLLAVSSLPLAAAGGLAGRPGTVVPGRPGLFLAGDWVGPEGYLADASLASARAAAQLAIAQLVEGGDGGEAVALGAQAVDDGRQRRAIA